MELRSGVNLSVKILAAFVVLHAAGATFAIAQFLFFPEQAVDLVPDHVPVVDVRYSLALMAVLPATFVAWDIVLLLGLRAGKRRALLVGAVSGGAAILGASIHAGYQEWATMAIDGSMGIVFLTLTAWAWKAGQWTPKPERASRT